MNIEKRATAAVTGRLSRCMGVDPFISEGDKEPIWDGNIYLYPNNEKRKNELIAQIPVQVKGCSKPRIDEDHLHYSIEIADLNAFAKRGGVVYFVVDVSRTDDETIFYSILLYYDIHKLQENAGTQKTISVKLKKLPDEPEQIRKILLSFAADRERQPTSIVWTPEDVARTGAKIEFHLPVQDSKIDLGLLREITTQPFYMYAKTECGVSFPFGKFDEPSENHTRIVRMRIDKPVSFNGVQYYDHCNLENENGKDFIAIGEAFRMPLSDKKVESQNTSMTVTLKGNLSSRIYDSKFLLALFQGGALCIDDERISRHPQNTDKDAIFWLKKTCKYLERIKDTLDYFGVHSDLDMDQLIEDDQKTIGLLLAAKDGKELLYDNKDLPCRFSSTWKIGNLTLLLLFEKGIDGYTVKSLSQEEDKLGFGFTDDNGEEKIIRGGSLFYCALKYEDFLCDNIEHERILASFRSISPEDFDIFFTHANNMLLEVIKAYDSQTKRDTQLLQFALDVADLLSTQEPQSIINRMQVIKRQRSLSNDEIAELVVLRKGKELSDMEKWATHVLLEENDDAGRSFDTLSEDEKKQIMGWPIYRLTKNA